MDFRCVSNHFGGRTFDLMEDYHHGETPLHTTPQILIGPTKKSYGILRLSRNDLYYIDEPDQIPPFRDWKIWHLSDLIQIPWPQLLFLQSQRLSLGNKKSVKSTFTCICMHAGKTILELLNLYTELC